MKIQSLVSAIVAMFLAAGGVAFAQGPGGRNDRDRDRGDQGYRSGPPGRFMPPGQMRREDRREDRREERLDDRRGDWRGERGAGPDNAFYRGGRLPPYYRTSNYVVDDWRGHRLSAPPRGYHWVQTGGDYVLVAIATGIILQILLNH
jgi:Ni/Co efflux regulator RcnB